MFTQKIKIKQTCRPNATDWIYNKETDNAMSKRKTTKGQITIYK